MACTPSSLGRDARGGLRILEKFAGGEEVRNFYFGGWRVVLLRTGNFVGGMVTEF